MPSSSHRGGMPCRRSAALRLPSPLIRFQRLPRAREARFSSPMVSTHSAISFDLLKLFARNVRSSHSVSKSARRSSTASKMPRTSPKNSPATSLPPAAKKSSRLSNNNPFSLWFDRSFLWIIQFHKTIAISTHIWYPKANIELYPKRDTP